MILSCRQALSTRFSAPARERNQGKQRPGEKHRRQGRREHKPSPRRHQQLVIVPAVRQSPPRALPRFNTWQYSPPVAARPALGMPAAYTEISPTSTRKVACPPFPFSPTASTARSATCRSPIPAISPSTRSTAGTLNLNEGELAPPTESQLEAWVLVDRWRREYDTLRPQSALDHWPRAPEAVEPWFSVSASPPLQARAACAVPA